MNFERVIGQLGFLASIWERQAAELKRAGPAKEPGERADNETRSKFCEESAAEYWAAMDVLQATTRADTPGREGGEREPDAG
jgi:hypothetical protein